MLCLCSKFFFHLVRLDDVAPVADSKHVPHAHLKKSIFYIEKQFPQYLSFKRKEAPYRYKHCGFFLKKNNVRYLT